MIMSIIRVNNYWCTQNLEFYIEILFICDFNIDTVSVTDCFRNYSSLTMVLKSANLSPNLQVTHDTSK